MGAHENITISSDPQLLDLHFIHSFISNAYWAKGRSLQDLQTCIDNSLNFGVYLNGRQIGYARVLTDYVAFAYIMDLFIDEQHRKNGYSNLLMKSLLAHDALKNIKTWKLATTDAHFLYKKFGFKALEKPENMMEKKSN